MYIVRFLQLAIWAKNSVCDFGHLARQVAPAGPLRCNKFDLLRILERVRAICLLAILPLCKDELATLASSHPDRWRLPATWPEPARLLPVDKLGAAACR